MLASDAEATLRSALARANVSIEAPRADAVWAAFKSFLDEPVDDAEDGVLYEVGVSGFGEPEAFQIDLVRQFSVYEDGEYDRMEQLHCTLRYPPSDLLRAHGSFHAWLEEHPSRGAFITAVDSRPEWDLVRELAAEPLRVRQHEV